MKSLGLILLTGLLPFSTLGHPGHGWYPDSGLHYLSSPEHSPVLIVAVVLLLLVLAKTHKKTGDA